MYTFDAITYAVMLLLLCHYVCWVVSIAQISFLWYSYYTTLIPYIDWLSVIETVSMNNNSNYIYVFNI